MTSDISHTTSLYESHIALGAKMVPFAGYLMPVQYATGILKEHTHTREKAGLFDVSHMGQIHIKGPEIASFLETLVPAALHTLQPGKQKYAFLTTPQGGVQDDLMITCLAEDHFFLVVNAGCKQADFEHISTHAPKELTLSMNETDCLLALQGPHAATLLSRLFPDVLDMPFMSVLQCKWQNMPFIISRSGYSGEDGFEISLPHTVAETFFKTLLAFEEVLPIGLGARDSLRLEAGLCLYGQDLTPDITPVEADLNWAIAKRRRQEGGFIGAEILQKQWQNGTTKKRFGLAPQGRALVRAGTSLFATPDSETAIGTVTSGGFGPTFGAPVAMGYLSTHLNLTEGNLVYADVRGKRLPCHIHTLPFVPHRYKR